MMHDEAMKAMSKKADEMMKKMATEHKGMSQAELYKLCEKVRMEHKDMGNSKGAHA